MFSSRNTYMRLYAIGQSEIFTSQQLKEGGKDSGLC
jgi:hypothetical protein